MALHDSVDDRQAKARAPFAFRGEERLETTLPDFLGHAPARVAHLDDDRIAFGARGDA